MEKRLSSGGDSDIAVISFSFPLSLRRELSQCGVLIAARPIVPEWTGKTIFPRDQRRKAAEGQSVACGRGNDRGGEQPVLKLPPHGSWPREKGYWTVFAISVRQTEQSFLKQAVGREESWREQMSFAGCLSEIYFPHSLVFLLWPQGTVTHKHKQ